MKKTLLFVVLALLLLSSVSAVSNLGTFQIDSNITLLQFCDSCSYVTVDSVVFPNGSLEFVNTSMTKTGQTFNYSFSGADVVGDYFYNVCGDKDGLVCEQITFLVTSDGSNNVNNWFYFGLLLALIFVSWLLVRIGNDLDPEHAVLKVLFNILALIMGVSSVIISYTVVSINVLSPTVVGNAFTVYKLVLWVFRLFALYLIGYLSWKGLKWLSEAIKR